jgi:hypothetical protein
MHALYIFASLTMLAAPYSSLIDKRLRDEGRFFGLGLVLSMLDHFS